MPLYIQVIRAIVRDIKSGRLTAGMYLPSSRQLAMELGVNRKTVVVAYEELIAQGWLSTAGTKGTIVSPVFPVPPGGDRKDGSRAGRDVAPYYRVLPPPDRSIALPAGEGLKLDEGAPDGRLFPPDVLARAYRRAIHGASAENRLQYRDPLGSMRLRQAIADMLRNQRALTVTPDEVCITRGSQNALFLATRILLKPSDTVIVETLTHEPTIAAFRAAGARIVVVPLDKGGIDVDSIERACREHHVRALFLTPHHQFPTTVALRPERRLRVLELAQQFGFAVLEDDYDHEFHFASQPLLPMAAYAPEHVLYLGSLSKLLLPTLRIGYIVAPRQVMPALAHAISVADGMGNRLTEDAAADLIVSGELQRHAHKVRKIYAQRRSQFAELLTARFGDDIAFSLPDGGLAFWLQFPGVDLDAMEARAQAAGLRFASSRSFMAGEDASRGLRIGFASLNMAEARHAVDALYLAMRG
ncbi:PLP-dependent aminotransferase family protein [Sphingobium lignivorans]|uniref:MocR-like pyridoxine biosynthesis transcription factor PdxR n=1 Tax=Sphingobium lignivorans TaxID=2735886 RepID=UPI0030B80E06